MARSMGIKTWVSLEPIIYLDQALLLIENFHHLVDFWAVGKINHSKELETAGTWSAALKDVEQSLNSVGAKYYIKSSLEQYREKKRHMGLQGCR